MTSQKDGPRPAHPVEPTFQALAYVAVGCGVLGWLWTDDWRWAVTGLLAFLTFGAVTSLYRRAGQ